MVWCQRHAHAGAMMGLDGVAPNYMMNVKRYCLIIAKSTAQSGRRAFQPLVDAGFVEIVYGAGDVGRLLCQHPLVASVHLTGSSSTFDAIVWGDNKAKVGAAAGRTPGERLMSCWCGKIWDLEPRKPFWGRRRGKGGCAAPCVTVCSSRPFVHCLLIWSGTLFPPCNMPAERQAGARQAGHWRARLHDALHHRAGRLEPRRPGVPCTRYLPMYEMIYVYNSSMRFLDNLLAD